jgi:hypothetical protein
VNTRPLKPGHWVRGAGITLALAALLTGACAAEPKSDHQRGTISKAIERKADIGKSAEAVIDAFEKDGKKQPWWPHVKDVAKNTGVVLKSVKFGIYTDLAPAAVDQAKVICAAMRSQIDPNAENAKVTEVRVFGIERREEIRIDGTKRIDEDEPMITTC